MNTRLLWFALIPLFFLPSIALPATVQVGVIHSRDVYAAGDVYPLAFQLSIQKPWSIHGTEAGQEPIVPTVLHVGQVPGVAVESIRFPAPEKMRLEYASGSMDVYSGQVLAAASLRVLENAAPGERMIAGTLSYQACSSTACLPPEEAAFSVRVSVALPGTKGRRINSDLLDSAARQAGRTPAQTGPETALWLTLIGLFVGGVALNLTPCVYPLIPITVSYFAGRAKGASGAVVLHAALYMLGLATTNAALGLFAALTGGMLGSALQSPWVLILVASVLVALAASFFGFWELRLPAALTGFAARNFGGPQGSLFMGLTLGIVAAPCIGPFILGLLSYVGQRGDPFIGFIYFFVLSLGLGLPLAVLAVFSGSVRKLPLSGDWMLWVRKFMGWVLVGMAAYIAAPLIPSHTGKFVMISAIMVAAAVHLGWVDRTGMQHKSFLAFKRVMGGLIAVCAVALLLYSAQEREGIVWAPYDPTLLLQASAQGKPVMLDFYAEWCGPCKAMERGAFRQPEVVELSLRFSTLRIDLTTREKEEDELIDRFRIRGVPTVLFLDGRGAERRELRIESLVDGDELLRRMRKGLAPTSESGRYPR